MKVVSRPPVCVALDTLKEGDVYLHSADQVVYMVGASYCNGVKSRQQIRLMDGLVCNYPGTNPGVVPLSGMFCEEEGGKK